MDCWQILGIEPYADKKAIKRSYARLLKQNRPDDDPQAFRELHDAYKQALLYSESEWQWEGPETLAPPDPIPEPGSSVQVEVPLPALPGTDFTGMDETVEICLAAPVAEVLPEPVEPANTPAGPSDADWFPNRNADWEALFEQVKTAFQAQNAGSDVALWKFIERNPSLLDIEFRAEAGDRLFGMVAEANEIAWQKKALFFKPPVLNYFNQVFAWDGKWREYSQMFPASQLDAVLPYLESHSADGKPTRTGIHPRVSHYYSRIAAFCLDILVFVAFMSGLEAVLAALEMNMNDDTLSTFRLNSALAYFLLLMPLLEASPWQASIGKKLLRLQVVNGKGGRMSWYHSLLRGFFACLCIVGFKITVWINAFMMSFNNMLLHDWISRSYVIKG
ncbi:RDD family protein [Candidatus Thiothrix sp. Deng01]|uniref:RDD family protein n=1 Tax=Candidatus Thiothrix phosphatis TaxID=3112415 RepID=A0ABU6CVU4_9GAMM|nr:RDD family protein [Candidatus Thiothrix sp. Deng01]MEB4590966.1 RDD family protein [Candidatus Thiothrix sp. Deng01]